MDKSHVHHLESEGFTPEQIKAFQKLGVRSINEAEAKKLGLKVKDGRTGKVTHPTGLYFPFTKDFGQVRCDDPPIRSGKAAKYITPTGKKSQAWLPDGCKAITEGWKDAAAGTWHGGTPTGALAGVSHYRCLPRGSGYTVVFDADGWTNPQVFAQLIHAGKWLNGKVTLLPPIEKEPKAGLCEYFQSGKTADDYKVLLDAALKPEDLLQEWPDHWEGFSDRLKIIRCCRLAACLGVLYLPDSESEAFIRQLGERFKTTGIRARDLQREAKKWKARRQQKKALPRLAQDYQLIQNRFGKVLRFNSLLNKPELAGEVFPVDESRLRLIVDHGMSIKSGKEDCIEIVLSIARKQAYNPVVEYLEYSHQEYGNEASILDGLAERYFGNSEPIAQAQLIKTLIRAVARAYNPGCKADEATVLAGAQGYGKSEFLKALASADWFCDDFSDPRDKDHLLKLHEAWIIEWAELHGLTKREATKVKAFMTCQRDRIRRPYGREAEQMPRPSVMLGTSNDTEFLTDPTGNRRWWIIKVNQKIPIDQVRQERDRIWAAAVSLYKSGETWWLDATQEEQADSIRKDYEVVDAWHELIEGYLDLRSEISVSQIFTDCLKIDPALQDNAKRSRIINILKRLEFSSNKSSVWRDGAKVRVWIRKNSENPSLGQNGVPGVPGVPESQNLDAASISSGTVVGTVPGTLKQLSVPSVPDSVPSLPNSDGSGTVEHPIKHAVPESVPETVPAISQLEQGLQSSGTAGTVGTANSRGQKKQNISVGDKVRYIGTDLKVCQNKTLEVVSVNCSRAEVKYPDWRVSHWVPLNELVEVAS